MKRLLLMFVAMLSAIGSFADGLALVDGLEFILDPIRKEATLVDNPYYSYKGDITVPEKFTVEGVEYRVTRFEKNCFAGCTDLTSIIIPSSVTSLGNDCFLDCSSLTSITIPSSVTSLGNECFKGCYCLNSIAIPSSITSLSDNCFNNCVSLKSVTIPLSVRSIGDGCFYNCESITNVAIPSSVTSLGDYCFSGCKGLISITCNNPIPPSLGDNTFSDNTYLVSSLYVPDVDAYKNAEGWKKFKYIKEFTEPCAKPTIGYADGQLMFIDATEGAKYHYTLTCSDVQNDKLNENGSVGLAACYDISVYATADGYKPSSKTTAKLYWVKADGSLATDNINAAKMRGVVVTAENGIVTVSGLSDGEKVEFYATDGKLIGAQKANSGTVSIATFEHVVICKMGSASIKILVR